MAIHTKWIKGIPEADKENRIKTLKSALPAFQILIEVLEKEAETPPDYTNPAWAYQQADRNGANRMLQDIINLINSIKD